MIEELRTRVSFLEKEVQIIPVLEKEIAKKNEKIKSLEDRLKLNSTNRNTPPSKDPIQIKASKQRIKGGKRGGQLGHKGSSLSKSEFVNEVKIHKPEKCICGKNLKNIDSTLIDTRQEFDIEIKHIVIEHQRYSKTCPCCQRVNKAPYPIHIKSDTQYGPGIKAFSTLMNVDYKVPFEKVSSLIEALFGLSISKGTVCNFIKSGSVNLEGFEKEIKQGLLGSEVIHADETGIVVAVKLHWMHVLSTDKYTYLRVHKKRGSEAFD